MALARFLQISDLHLGRPFAWLQGARREDRRRDQLRVLEAAVSQAIERECHAILVPGDVFDSPLPDAATLASVTRLFDVTGCPPVFIAPGNHDPFSTRAACWHPRLLEARGLAWPSHVHVFDTPAWSPHELADLDGVRIWGRAFASGAETLERPLAAAALTDVTPAGSKSIDVAVFHGSREQVCPPGQKITAPFSDDEVATSPFAYHAVGHYHTVSRIEQKFADGMRSAGARLAYAGSAVALDLTETGPHGAAEVRVEFGHRLPFVEVEPVELDPRRCYAVAVDVTGCPTADHIDRRVMKGLDLAGVSESDLAMVSLTGRLSPGIRWGGPGAELRTHAFHLRFDTTGLRPHHDLAALREREARTTEERFARVLLGQIDAETDTERRALLESALTFGLDAFRLGEVITPVEETIE